MTPSDPGFICTVHLNRALALYGAWWRRVNQARCPGPPWTYDWAYRGRDYAQQYVKNFLFRKIERRLCRAFPYKLASQQSQFVLMRCIYS